MGHLGTAVQIFNGLVAQAQVREEVGPLPAKLVNVLTAVVGWNDNAANPQIMASDLLRKIRHRHAFRHWTMRHLDQACVEGLGRTSFKDP